MSESRPIRVLVAEDHFLTRFGTVRFLEVQPDIRVVGEAEDGARAVSLYRELKPDVAIVDLKMPRMTGEQVITNICREFPQARILVLTHYEADEDIFKAVGAGAYGYLTKEAHGRDILDAIRTIHGGKRYLPAEIAGRLAERMSQTALSARELQVLRSLGKGKTNREIAKELGLAEKTASFYVSNILGKLGAKTRTEAVVIGQQRGLIPHT